MDIALDQIDDNAKLNCRGEIKPHECVNLAKDIGSNGLLQPVVVRKFQEEDSQKHNVTKPYQLVAGFRRFTAHKILERKSIACNLIEISFEKARFLNLSENLQRKDLNILQEAKSVKVLLDLGYSQEEIGDELKQSRGWAQIRCKLLGLPEEIQLEAAAGLVNQEQIRALSGMTTRDEQFDFVKRIKTAKLKGRKLNKADYVITRAKKNEKRQRTKTEIFEMMEHIIDSIKGNFGTRCLAWAAGQITSEELHTDIKIQADAIGVKYDPPQS